EILGNNAGSLPTFASYVDFATLTDDEIRSFYSDRLHASAERDDAGRLRYPCPWCLHSPSKKPLRVEMAGKRRGRFICGNRQCSRRGNFATIEIKRAAIKGNDLTKGEAWSRVRAFFNTLRWTAKQERNEDETVTQQTRVPNVAAI